MPSPPPTTCWQLLWTTISSRAMPWVLTPRQILWKRCVDMNDRALRNIVVGLGGKGRRHGRGRITFVITVASEIMAILCLADNMEDLKNRLGKIIVAYNYCRRACDRRASSMQWAPWPPSLRTP